MNRKDPIRFSPHLYRARNLVQRFFNKIKQCRRIATRYDKLAADYLAFIKLASIRLWLRTYEPSLGGSRPSSSSRNTAPDHAARVQQVLISMTGCDDISPTSYESTNVVVVLLDFSLGRQPVRDIASERATFTLPEEIGPLSNCLLVTLRRHRNFLLPNIAFILRSILLFLGQLGGSGLDSDQGSWTDMAELYRTRCPGARGDRLSPGCGKSATFPGFLE